MTATTRAKATNNNGTGGTAEEAVRLYLLFLEDPASLRDDKAIQAKTKAVLDAKGPIEKLKALAALERAATVDEAPLREGFVAHALEWGKTNKVPASAFRELKVPVDVLTRAGFTNVAPKGRVKRGSGGTRAKAVPMGEITAKIPLVFAGGKFALVDVEAKIGGSPATVRKAVAALIVAKTVRALGADPEYKGQGRAPHQYEVAAAK